MAVYIDAFDTVTINQSIETNLYSAICREQTRGAIDKSITKGNDQKLTILFTVI